jgi:glycosyltransferase involved in cell wall biosynthesis
VPGAWELWTPSVLVGILTRGIVPTRWACGYRDLNIPPGGKPIFLSGMPFDHARNEACKAALAGGYKWLFFLDDDVIPPPDAIEKLARHELDIVSGLYYRRHVPVEPVALRNVPGGRQYVRDFKPGDVVEVDVVGAGCLLIHRRVLEAVPKPWFEWLCDREDLPKSQQISEDYAFCEKAKRNGFRIYLDTSVQCDHAGYGKAVYGGKFEPLGI